MTILNNIKQFKPF